MIKALREKLGWSQNELSRRSGVRQSVLSDIESGVTRNPRIGTLMKIAKALNVPVEFLVRE